MPNFCPRSRIHVFRFRWKVASYGAIIRSSVSTPYPAETIASSHEPTPKCDRRRSMPAIICKCCLPTYICAAGRMNRDNSPSLRRSRSGSSKSASVRGFVQQTAFFLVQLPTTNILISRRPILYTAIRLAPVPWQSPSPAYQMASMWPRILSAAAHSFCSNPRFAPLPDLAVAFTDFFVTLTIPCNVVCTSSFYSRKRPQRKDFDRLVLSLEQGVRVCDRGHCHCNRSSFGEGPWPVRLPENMFLLFFKIRLSNSRMLGAGCSKATISLYDIN